MEQSYGQNFHYSINTYTNSLGLVITGKELAHLVKLDSEYIIVFRLTLRQYRRLIAGDPPILNGLLGRITRRKVYDGRGQPVSRFCVECELHKNVANYSVAADIACRLLARAFALKSATIIEKITTDRTR